MPEDFSNESWICGEEIAFGCLIEDDEDSNTGQQYDWEWEMDGDEGSATMDMADTEED